MAGASGAHVEIRGSVAMKTAPEGPLRERLRAQYTWLLTHRLAPVVETCGWADDGYDMEILHPLEHDPFCTTNLIAPAERLWSYPAEVMLDPYLHQQWATTKVMQFPSIIQDHLLGEVRDKFTYVMTRSRNLKRCLTHGDLTRSNVMKKFRGSATLIDPIPAHPMCADIWAFDVSTVLISLLGLEHVCYGWPAPSDTDRQWIEQLLLRMNMVEIEAVRYMAVVQIGRRLPYFPEETHDGLIEIAREALRIRP